MRQSNLLKRGPKWPWPALDLLGISSVPGIPQLIKSHGGDMPELLTGSYFPTIQSATDGSADLRQTERYRVCYVLGVKTSNGVH